MQTTLGNSDGPTGHSRFQLGNLGEYTFIWSTKNGHLSMVFESKMPPVDYYVHGSNLTFFGFLGSDTFMRTGDGR